MRVLIAFLYDQEASTINIALFAEDALERQRDTLFPDHEVRVKLDSGYSKENSLIQGVDIFKIGVWLDKNYAWIVLNNNTRGVTLIWLANPPGTSTNTEENTV